MVIVFLLRRPELEVSNVPSIVIYRHPQFHINIGVVNFENLIRAVTNQVDQKRAVPRGTFLEAYHIHTLIFICCFLTHNLLQTPIWAAASCSGVSAFTLLANITWKYFWQQWLAHILNLVFGSIFWSFSVNAWPSIIGKRIFGQLT